MNLPAMDHLAAWVCSKLFSRFRRIPLRLTPEDMRYMRLSFSQFGEDLVIVEHLIALPLEKRGIYVDAGCFDPFRYSNTRILNLLGWKGMNIDASKESINVFNAARPHDINICAALDQTCGQDEFLSMRSGATSRLAKAGNPLPENYSAIKRKSVRTTTLRKLLDESELADEQIDLLDIDCEGADFAVLKGFELETRRPRIICFESHSELETGDINNLLKNNTYRCVARLGPSAIFVDGMGDFNIERL